jgi:hypothetical protein
MPDEKTGRILEILRKLPDKKTEGLKTLFWEELNYDQEDQVIAIADWKQEDRDLLAETPVLFASGGRDHGFHIILCRLKDQKIKRGLERILVNRLLKDHPYSLFIVSNEDQNHWHFINVKAQETDSRVKQRVLRRISVSHEDRLRTASERISMLDLTSNQPELFGLEPVKIQQSHDEAFNVEAVTDDFFKDYQKIFTSLQKELLNYITDPKWTHDFALQFLNRLMFLYFVQRKGWLDNDSEFLWNYWVAYKRSHRPQDTFITEWLNILFFEAFNNCFQNRAELDYLPEKYRTSFSLMPYLNGGLYRKNDLDQAPVPISDQQMESIFGVLEGYNFTISEDTPLDQEVAVDPEMIGKVYESLVNISTESDERSEAGIFYTPRVEIDLMCRLALVDMLSNHLGEEFKNPLYNLVFAYDQAEKQEADQEILGLEMWPKIGELLSDITVIDPACGSGSFLVGMLLILDDLISRYEKITGKPESSYERRKRIIGKSLYGVDVKEWAVRVAELRLWLQLAIETEIEPTTRMLTPLLPNLTFKIRQGDSLVQEIGGINLRQRHGGLISAAIKGRITALKADKLKYFYNDNPPRNEKLLLHDEELIYIDLVKEKLHSVKNQIAEIRQIQAPLRNLLGEVQNPQISIDQQKKIQNLEALEQQETRLASALSKLQAGSILPFVWDISFVEIFDGDQAGFDIVIGNPPYVRQEKIRDPNLPDGLAEENKKEYKEKLARSVYCLYPLTFGANPDKPVWKLDAKSDLYIYFYFLCLGLLNSKGNLCFITSNSWLDVDFGSDLQWFSLSRCEVKLVIDNQVKRSFKNADINALIALLTTPTDSRLNRVESLENLTRFVMFKVPFEIGLSPVVWSEIDGALLKYFQPEYSCRPMRQSELIQSGINDENGEYTNGKWGAIFLRAPNIYAEILERNKGDLIPLSGLLNYEYGIKTGSVDFFYITEQKMKDFHIEKEYLKGFVSSSQSITGFTLKPDCFLLFCDKSKDEIKGTNLLEYIKWGEAKQINSLPSVSSHKPFWYSIKGSPFQVLLLQFWDKRFWTPYTLDELYCSNNFYFGNSNYHSLDAIITLLNSTFYFFQITILGRTNQGQGVLTTYGPEFSKIIVPDPRKIDFQSLKEIFINIQNRDILPIEDELKNKERREFDAIIFDYLKMSNSEIDDLYGFILDSVKNRISRANSN